MQLVLTMFISEFYDKNYYNYTLFYIKYYSNFMKCKEIPTLSTKKKKCLQNK